MIKKNNVTLDEPLSIYDFNIASFSLRDGLIRILKGEMVSGTVDVHRSFSPENDYVKIFPRTSVWEYLCGASSIDKAYEVKANEINDDQLLQQLGYLHQ